MPPPERAGARAFTRAGRERNRRPPSPPIATAAIGGGGVVERRRPRSTRARTPQHRSSRLLRHRAQRVPGGQSHILRTFSTTAHWVTGGVVVSEAACALWAGGQKQHEMLLSYVPHVAGRGREAWSGGGRWHTTTFLQRLPTCQQDAARPPPTPYCQKWAAPGMSKQQDVGTGRRSTSGRARTRCRSRARSRRRLRRRARPPAARAPTSRRGGSFF
jgi:hypothetical protein